MKGFWNHFDGSSVRPEQEFTKFVTAVDGTATGGTKIIPADKLTALQRQWDKDEHSAKSLLTQKLPDSTLMRIHTKRTFLKGGTLSLTNTPRKDCTHRQTLDKSFLSSNAHPKAMYKSF